MTEAPSSLADEVRARAEATRLPPRAERKKIRKRAGVTLKRLAEELGVSEAAVWHWENGTEGQGPSEANAARYRALLDDLRQAVA